MKSNRDIGMMHHTFMVHYSKAIDKTIRDNIKVICKKCYSDEGKHICKEQTGDILYEHHIVILKLLNKKPVWDGFIEEISRNFKKDIITWFKGFISVDDKISWDRDIIGKYMNNHFPNTADNPNQKYFDYDDYDEID